MKKNKILVTGSAGFLGGSMCFELLKNNHKVVGLDSYQNSNQTTTKKIKDIFKDSFKFYQIDLSNNPGLLNDIFIDEKPNIVIHFAAEKSVINSKDMPFHYWKNNLYSTVNLIEAMHISKCSNLIYSSSAAVYGNNINQPIKEDALLNSITPYSNTKLASEMFIKDISKKGELNSIILRYFNPVSSHSDQIILEDLKDKDSTLMQEIIKTAIGINKNLKIYGSDYDTPDGTCIRDFIHVQDLIEAHFESMYIVNEIEGSIVMNVGTGQPISVLELVKAFENYNNIKINYIFEARRADEISTSFASVSYIKEKLGWTAKRDIKDMVIDSWKPYS